MMGGLLSWRTTTNTVKYRFQEMQSHQSGGNSEEILDTVSTLEAILSKLSPTSGVTKKLLSRHFVVYDLLVQLEDFILLLAKKNRLQRLIHNSRMKKRLDDIHSSLHRSIKCLQEDITRLLDKVNDQTSNGTESSKDSNKKIVFIARLKASSYLAQSKNQEASDLWDKFIGLENKMTGKNFILSLF